MMSSPDDVGITLGDLVYDEAADERRDVDVTVTYKDEKGLLSAFKGIEVKKIGRKLDVTQVEQLIAKFADMPAINHRAIVSASGFSKPAVRKAAAHGVELFTFWDWTNPMVGFDHIKFAPCITGQQSIYTFASAPHVVFNPTEISRDEIRSQITDRSAVRNAAGMPHPVYKTIRDLTDAMEIMVLNSDDVHQFVQSLPSGKPEPISVNVQLPEDVYVEIGNESMRVTDALFTGPAMRVDSALSLNFKVLLEYGQTAPIAGCTIAELANGTLVAMAVANLNRSIKLVPIPLSIRNQDKVRLLKLR